MLVGISALPLVGIMALWNHLPESPRFDLLHGNIESLQKTLEKVAKDNGKPMPKGLVNARTTVTCTSCSQRAK